MGVIADSLNKQSTRQRLTNLQNIKGQIDAENKRKERVQSLLDWKRQNIDNVREGRPAMSRPGGGPLAPDENTRYIPENERKQRTLSDVSSEGMKDFYNITESSPQDVAGQLEKEDEQRKHLAQVQSAEAYRSNLIRERQIARDAAKAEAERNKAEWVRGADGQMHKRKPEDGDEPADNNVTEAELYLGANKGDRAKALEQMQKGKEQAAKARGKSQGSSSRKPEYPLLETKKEGEVYVDEYGYTDKKGKKVVMERKYHNEPSKSSQQDAMQKFLEGKGVNTKKEEFSGKKSISLKAIRQKYPDASESDDELIKHYKSLGYDVSE